MLVEQAKGTLLGLVALAGQVLEGLATSCLLPAAHNAAMLVLDEVRLRETTGGVLRRSVKDLGLGANGRDSGHLILRTRFLFLVEKLMTGPRSARARTMNTAYIRNAEGDFVCPVAGCGSIKKRQNTMFYHMKKHTGDMSHICSVPGCGAGFIQKSGLDQHVVQKHSTTVGWSCPFCDHGAKMKANLIIHIGRRHCSDWIPPFTEAGGCGGCKKSFTSEGGYYYHALQCFAAPPDASEKLALLTETG